MLDAVGSSGPHHAFLGTMLQRLTERARERSLGGLEFTPEGLVAAYNKSPHKIRAFIQALGESSTPDMLIMVWRVIQGMSIERLTAQYVLEQEFRLEVMLRSPYGDPVETYVSTNVNDLALVRHFSIMKMDGGPIVDGFYPLQVS